MRSSRPLCPQHGACLQCHGLHARSPAAAQVKDLVEFAMDLSHTASEPRPVAPQATLRGAWKAPPTGQRWLGWRPTATSMWWHRRRLVRTYNQLPTRPSSDDGWAVTARPCALVRPRSCCRRHWYSAREHSNPQQSVTVFPARCLPQLSWLPYEIACGPSVQGPCWVCNRHQLRGFRAPASGAPGCPVGSLESTANRAKMVSLMSLCDLPTVAWSPSGEDTWSATRPSGSERRVVIAFFFLVGAATAMDWWCASKSCNESGLTRASSGWQTAVVAAVAAAAICVGNVWRCWA